MSEIAARWNKVLKTGGIEATFNPVDLNTIMFTLLRGQDTMDVCKRLAIPHRCCLLSVAGLISAYLLLANVWC